LAHDSIAPTVLQIAWKRFGILTTINGDIIGRVIATVFYFTVLLPFGIISALFTDPLQRKGANKTPRWIDREPVSTALDDARRQG
jgi:hypothetical protein